MKPLSERYLDRHLIQVGDLTRCFRARDAMLDRSVFIKLLNPKLVEDKEIHARFAREAKAVARLDHPNLVRIYESGEDPHEGFYMVFEWVEGETLRATFARGERFAGEKLTDLARQLLSGLTALHGVGILHRDLKPENILVKEMPGTGSLFKITDFSLAALTDAPLLTHHQAIVGTPAYIAPEVASGQAQSEVADLFAVGVILLEAVTGKHPFIAENIVETLRRVREQNIVVNETTVPNLTKESRELIARLLEKDPSQRPASANEALALLEASVQLSPIAERPKKHGRFYLAAAVVVVTVWIVLMSQMHKKDEMVSSPERSSSLQSSSEQQSQPEFRSAPDIEDHENSDSVPAITPTSSVSIKTIPLGAKSSEKISEKTGVQPVFTAQMADSVDLYLITEPWAHVFYHGELLGTTPLSEPLRLPKGEQDFVLRNSAFPPVNLHLNLNSPTVHKQVNLADYVALVKVKVKPWGELYLDGEHIGTTPLPNPLYVSPGHHTVRISHPEMTAVSQELVTTAGETLSVEADLTQNQIIVRPQ